jgi:hypothetical protein
MKYCKAIAATSLMRSELLKSLDTLRGKECWGFIGGPGTGSMITLDFGDKIPRKKAVSNPTLSSEQQKFQGEVVLFIQFAAWRIDFASSVICSSATPNNLDGPFGEGLRSILRKRGKNDLMILIFNQSPISANHIGNNSWQISISHATIPTRL